MSIRAQGIPPVETFFRFNDTNTGAIAIDEIANSEWIMEQITAHWASVPTTSESLTLVKDSVEGASYDTTLISFDPTVDGVQNLVCNNPFRFAKGDRVVVAYPGTDSIACGVEIMLRQVKRRV